MSDPLAIIKDHASQGAILRERFFQHEAETIDKAAFAVSLAVASGHKLLICGNGGSAADAQHMAAEFVNRFLIERPGLPAIALSTDTSAITAIGNDRSFELIFARQIEALGAPGDVLLAISTSGSSANVTAAIAAAKEKGMLVVGLTGATGAMAALCDHLIAVPDRHTPLIQEIHLAVEHLLCRLVDWYLFENPDKITEALTTDQDEG